MRMMRNEVLASSIQIPNPSHSRENVLYPKDKSRSNIDTDNGISMRKVVPPSCLNVPARSEISQGFAANVLFPHVAELPNMNENQSKDHTLSQGFLYYNRRQFDEAFKHLRRNLKGKSRGNFLNHFLLGLCSFQLEKKKEALTYFSNSLKLSGSRTKYEEALAFFNRSLTYIKLKNQMENAMHDVNMAIESYPSEPLFHTCRALLYRRLGRFEEAQRDYQTIRTIQAKAARDLNESITRKETMIISSPDKNMKSSILSKTSSSARSLYSIGSVDLKTKLYGEVHSALKCAPSERTQGQIELLVKESRMMNAFAHFDVQQLHTLWRYLEYKIFASNERLFEEGDVANDYYLVWSGSVSARVGKRHSIAQHTSKNVAFALKMEREVKVNTMTAGETLGEAILSEDGVRKASCVIEEPNTEIIVLNRKHFDSTFHLFLDKMRKEKIDFLSGFDFLSDWKWEELNLLAQVCRKKIYHSGDIIIKQNTSADTLYFMHTGMVSLHRSLTTFDTTLITLSKGDVFGEASLLRDDLSLFPYSARCETMTICYRLDKIQITKDQWQRLESGSKSVSKFVLPDDAILIKSHLDERKFKRQRATFIKALKKRQESKSKNRSRR